MDRFIEQYGAEPYAIDDADLRLCPVRGVAYQRHMAADRVEYGADYLEKCRLYEGTPIACAVNAARIALVSRYTTGLMLDIGAGTGDFAKQRPDTFAYDVNLPAEMELRAELLFTDAFASFNAFSLWDVLEHVEDVDNYFKHMRHGAYLFVSIPVFASLWSIRRSKHHRPGEHLYYWTERGFINWAACHGFRLLEVSWAECAAGREDIAQFAFCRDLSPLANEQTIEEVS